MDKEMQKSIDIRDKKVCVIGLGYVGFPLAVQASLKGFEVYGFDVDREKCERIKKGENIVDEEYLEPLLKYSRISIIEKPEELSECEIFVIAVPTPVDEKHYPDLSFVVSATQQVADHMKPGALVLVVDDQADGRAGGQAFEHAGEDPHPVRFASLGDMAALPRPDGRIRSICRV